MQKLVGAFDALGREHLAYAQIDLGEIVNGDLRAGGCGFSAGGRRFPQQRGLLGGDLGFESAHLFDRRFGIDTREDALNLADLLAGLQLSPGERIEPHRFERFRHAKLRPDLGAGFRKYGREQNCRDAQCFCRSVESAIEGRLRLGILLLGELPGRLFDDELVHCRDETPDDLETLGEFKIVERLGCRADRFASHLPDLVIAAAWNRSAAVLMDHSECAARQIAKAVRQVRVVSSH